MAVPAKQPLSLSKKLMLGFGALVVVGAAVGVTVWRLTAKKDEVREGPPMGGCCAICRAHAPAPQAKRQQLI